MVVVAYLVGWFHVYGMPLLIASGVCMFVWFWSMGDGAPRPIRRLRRVLPILLVPALVYGVVYSVDKVSPTNHLAGTLVADHGVDGTIEVGALTGSSRTRRYAHLRYDITIHYADGSTRTDNVDLLDALETNDEWWGEFVDRHRQGGVVLTMRYLPHFPQAWSVTGVRAG